MTAISDLVGDASRAFGKVRFLAATDACGWRSLITIPNEEFQSAANATAAVRLIEREMARVPRGVLQGANWLLSVPAVGPDGFEIYLSRENGVIRAFFGELEDEFHSLEQAMAWVARALSSDYQLRVVSVGGKPREWFLERVDKRDDGLSLGRGSPILFRRFRSLSVRIRSNLFAP